MGQPAPRGRITKRCCSCAFGAALAQLWVIAVLGQDAPRRGGDRPDAGGPYPKLPGAVTKAPDWIGTDAPFDVARFFAAVPRDRNAAPLYLDAFFEFGSDVAACFPEGPERDRRLRAAEDRAKRYMDLYEALEKDPKAVPAEAIDAVIKPYETGFRKFAEAQRRDRCVFEAGLGDEALIPHTQAARQVARVASLRVRRAVEQADFDAAIRDVEAVLRLVRDLRPRGSIDHPNGRGGHHRASRLRRHGQGDSRRPRSPRRALRPPAQGVPQPRGKLERRLCRRALRGVSDGPRLAPGSRPEAGTVRRANIARRKFPAGSRLE